MPVDHQPASSAPPPNAEPVDPVAASEAGPEPARGDLARIDLTRIDLARIDLGLMPYDQAQDVQREAHARVAAGGAERVLFVEHPAVITLSRRKDVRRNLLVSPDCLATRDIDLAETDRGGDVTAHGPGQLVAYPILRLGDHNLNLSRYMRLLETVAIDTAAAFGVVAHREEGATGVWVARRGQRDAKLCAMGVRIARNTTSHGLAFNVSTNLALFELIDPCGLGHRPVTSLAELLGEACPSMPEVQATVFACLQAALADARKAEAAPG